MAGKAYFLNESDKKKVKRLIASSNAGTPVLSRQPLPTSRPPRDRGDVSDFIRLVEITGSITARSGTTLGSGTAQPVDAADLTSDLGDTITVYNKSPRALSGATETVYAIVVKLSGRWLIIDTLDPIWFMSYTGFGADKIFYSDGTGSTNLKFGAEECP